MMRVIICFHLGRLLLMDREMQVDADFAWGVSWG